MASDLPEDPSAYGEGGHLEQRARRKPPSRHPTSATASLTLRTESEKGEFMAWIASRDGRSRRRLQRLGRDLDWLREMAREYGLDPGELRNLV